MNTRRDHVFPRSARDPGTDAGGRDAVATGEPDPSTPPRRHCHDHQSLGPRLPPLPPHSRTNLDKLARLSRADEEPRLAIPGRIAVAGRAASDDVRAPAARRVVREARGRGALVRAARGPRRLVIVAVVATVAVIAVARTRRRRRVGRRRRRPARAARQRAVDEPGDGPTFARVGEPDTDRAHTARAAQELFGAVDRVDKRDEARACRRRRRRRLARRAPIAARDRVGRRRSLGLQKAGRDRADARARVAHRRQQRRGQREPAHGWRRRRRRAVVSRRAGLARTVAVAVVGVLFADDRADP